MDSLRAIVTADIRVTIDKTAKGKDSARVDVVWNQELIKDPGHYYGFHCKFHFSTHNKCTHTHTHKSDMSTVKRGYHRQYVEVSKQNTLHHPSNSGPRGQRHS